MQAIAHPTLSTISNPMLRRIYSIWLNMMTLDVGLVSIATGRWSVVLMKSCRGVCPQGVPVQPHSHCFVVDGCKIHASRQTPVSIWLAMLANTLRPICKEEPTVTADVIVTKAIVIVLFMAILIAQRFLVQ